MRLKKFINAAGWPRIIIGVFLAVLFAVTPLVNVNIWTSFSDTLVRFGMNGVMVLAMLPMIRSGCGLNFGLGLGIISGLLGALLSIEFGVGGPAGLFMAMGLGLLFGAVAGLGYGLLLNRVKGDEMMIATYVGFSSVAFMCMAWLLLPFKSPVMVWGFGGSGLRTTVSVGDYWGRTLSDFLGFKFLETFFVPTGMILFFLLVCFLVWLFFESKTGQAISSVGQNPEFARASGVNVNKMRVISVMVSTMLGAVGIVVYEQSFGFIQLYTAPLYMAFPAVASVLLGGASVNRATITNVIVGTFLFQGLLTMTPSVINSAIGSDISEVVRLLVSNGIIIYALTRRERETR